MIPRWFKNREEERLKEEAKQAKVYESRRFMNDWEELQRADIRRGSLKNQMIAVLFIAMLLFSSMLGFYVGTFIDNLF